MFDNLQRLLRKVEVKPIDLRFEMDVNPDGKHIVRIVRLENNQTQPIDNMSTLLAYDFREESIEDGHNVIRILKEEDRQTLLSLKSLNPEIMPDGTLLFDIEPPILYYLRKKNIAETKVAQSVTVLENPVKPTADVTYNSASGISVRVGYKLEDQQELVQDRDLKLTKDGKYARLGNAFVPVGEVSPVVAELLQQGSISYPVKATPVFFQRDLMRFKKEFNTILSDQASSINIVTDKLTPLVTVAKNPQGWLDFDVCYDAGGIDLPRDLLRNAKENGDTYIQFDAQTWVQVDQPTIDKTEQKLKALEADVTENGYRFPVGEFLSLEEFIENLGGTRRPDEAYQEFISQLIHKRNINEVEEFDSVTVLDEPFKPTVEVTYDQTSGLTVHAGYKIKGQKKLLHPSGLKMTRDGKYTHIGNIFAPVGKLSRDAKQLLQLGSIAYSLNDIPIFFQRDLVLLKKEFNAVLTDEVGKIQIVTDKTKPVINVSKDPQGWLDFDIQYNAGGFELPRNLLMKAKENGDNYIQLDSQTWVKVDQRTIDKTEEKLKALEADLTENGYRLPASEFVSLEEFIDAIGGTSVLDAAYREFISQLTGFQANPTFTLPNDFENHLIVNGLNLRPYQRAGIHWLNWLRENHLHGVLADDMGLGKTLQSLAVLRLAYEKTKSQNHSLVIAPKSVLLHWEREINRVFTFMRTYVYHGPGRRRDFFRSSIPYIFITTYEVVVRDHEFLTTIPFSYLILDEATRIKNPEAKRSQAIKALNAEHRLALSGTPVENRPSELWSLFDFLMKGHLGKHGTFVRVYEESILAGRGDAARRLGRRIKPFLLRRKKETVADDLPPKIVSTEWVALTKEQRNLYGAMQDQIKDLRNSIRRGEQVNYTSNILPVLTKLKQICDHPALVTGETSPVLGRSDKFDAIIEKIDEIVDNGDKVIVFSHFLNMLNLFENVLKEKDYPYIRIDGGTNNRQVLIDSVNEGRAKVALLSIMASGYGINLTGANHVIHADRWWNPAVEDQATDRAHRIGQSKTVFVWHFLTTGTLEEKIDRMLTKKRDIAGQIIDAASAGEHKWSREDLLELLKPLD